MIVGRLIPAGTGAGMNRLRVAASSRDTALRAAQRRMQEALIAPDSAEELRAAELARTPRDRQPARATIRWARSCRAATGSTPTPGIICKT